jgi:ADP-ribosylglycohydrolase
MLSGSSSELYGAHTGLISKWRPQHERNCDRSRTYSRSCPGCTDGVGDGGIAFGGDSILNPDMRSRFRGCLVGGAVGDALGAPVEFMNQREIVQRFGQSGIRDYVPAYGRLGAITDDTQMTLFTAEGMLRTYVRGCMRGLSTFTGVTDHAYLRWLETQGYKSPIDIGHDGWLWDQKSLHSARAPGRTCLSALKSKRGFGDSATNDSKGCGGVMRVAPVGLYGWHRRAEGGAASEFFTVASEISGLTHGHPTGQWPAGVFALLVMRCLDGVPVVEALKEATGILKTKERHEETLNAIQVAVGLAESGLPPGAEQVEKLGGGWIAEEALAISLYCVLVAKDFEHGIALAVNHGGDSDSTGAIAGNLLGAMLGVEAIPERWRMPLELSDVVETVADDLLDYPTWNIGEYVTDGDNERIWARYPGW